MKNLMCMLMRLVSRTRRGNAEERYLAESTDVSEFEVRAQSLERRRA